LRNPLLLFFCSLIALWLAAQIGMRFRAWRSRASIPDETDFNLILGSTLTLLGLIIGFTFSMAVSRYDQRKNLEEEEANAIGTEYLRANLLSEPAATHVRSLLTAYTDQRILYYTTKEREKLSSINASTSRLQSDLWSAVATAASPQPTTLETLAVSGMNDVINAQGYTEAAWRNRVPIGAWAMLFSIAIFANFMVGYSAHKRSSLLILVLPVALSVCMALIADIDAPRGGFIRVLPQNLQALRSSLPPNG
jgi:hypothetical protein